MAFAVEIAIAVARKDTSGFQIKNKQDLYQALTNREIFTSILEQGLDYILSDKETFDDTSRFDQLQKDNRDKPVCTIQPILGLTQFIRSDSKDAKQCELLDVTIRNAKRLKQLTEDILDVTRIENGSLIVNLETFNLNQIISDIVEDYRNEIERFGSDVKLIHEGQNEIIQVDGDKNRLTQVISNLIDNAVKFTTQGSITIKAEIEKEDDGKALVSVTDTGPGIDPEIMPRLFTKFVAKSNKGTGLGLFISKSIIEAHRGRIWALNNYSLDGNSIRGATFAFNISLSRSRKSK